MTNADAIDISNDTYVGDFDVVVVDIIHDSYIYVDVTYRTPFQTTIHLSFDADGVMFDDVDERKHTIASQVGHGGSEPDGNRRWTTIHTCRTGSGDAGAG